MSLEIRGGGAYGNMQHPKGIFRDRHQYPKDVGTIVTGYRLSSFS
jgi:hypothetical protein